MSDFAAFVRLGIGHIVSLDAMDHLLFLLVLTVIYRPREWRSLLWAVSAFTAGHSITLALAVTDVVRFPTQLIETLIPVTIVATAVVNLVHLRREALEPRVLLVGLFGLIHGAGFANYLRALFLESVAVPLLGFNVGIEVGQLVVVGTLWFALLLLDRWIARRDAAALHTSHQLRVAVVSGVVAIVASVWTAARIP